MQNLVKLLPRKFTYMRIVIAKKAYVLTMHDNLYVFYLFYCVQFSVGGYFLQIYFVNYTYE